MSQDSVESKVTAEHPRFAKPQRVAFVQSAWHRDVVAVCREAFLAEIEARHIGRASIDVFEVPGAFEIPLHVQLLAKTRRYTRVSRVSFSVGGSSPTTASHSPYRATLTVSGSVKPGSTPAVVAGVN